MLEWSGGKPKKESPRRDQACSSRPDYCRRSRRRRTDWRRSGLAPIRDAFAGGNDDRLFDRCRGHAFLPLQQIRPMIETVPLANAAEAYGRMMRNEARFRIVLVTGPNSRSRAESARRLAFPAQALFSVHS